MTFDDNTARRALQIVSPEITLEGTETAEKVESLLEKAIENNFSHLLRIWKQRGEVSLMSLIYNLPASDRFRESVEEYENVVYAAAAVVLQRNDFTYNQERSTWYYNKA
ncbi:hypothetical protein HZA98_01585 [Candidatus Woesearchaeota archaeon]|nr:hypothetical protein [Candidatus Woesearchaeota archaeon]